MYQAILDFPNQFARSLKAADEVDLPKIQQKSFVYLAGMGGSSLPGDIVNDYCQKQILHIHRDYGLPAFINQEDFLICASYSGNTEETLDAFYKACEKKIPTIVLTHGGKLKEVAVKEKIPVIEIPESIQPRCAAGYFFTSLVCILEKIGKLEKQVYKIQNLGAYLLGNLNQYDKLGEKLAPLLFEKVPLIYSGNLFSSLCRISKIKFNENCKIQSFYNVFPELNHNEMVGFTQLMIKPIILYFKSRFVDSRNLKRMQIMEDLLKNKMPFHSIELKGNSHLEQLFEGLMIMDFATCYLAKKYGIDPAPVAMVEDFKKKLK